MWRIHIDEVRPQLSTIGERRIHISEILSISIIIEENRRLKRKLEDYERKEKTKKEDRRKLIRKEPKLHDKNIRAKIAH